MENTDAKYPGGSRNAWLSSLKTGDSVLVVEAQRGQPTERIIHSAQIRRTPKHIYLGTGKRSWTTGYRDDPGAGPRAIVPHDFVFASRTQP